MRLVELTGQSTRAIRGLSKPLIHSAFIADLRLWIAAPRVAHQSDFRRQTGEFRRHPTRPFWRIIDSMGMFTVLREQATRLGDHLRVPQTAAAHVDAPALPPRFRELGPNEPIKAVVERVASGNEINDGEVRALIAAAGGYGTRRWKAALAAAWALGRARCDPEHRPRIIRALAAILRTRNWSLNGCTGPLTLGCSIGAAWALPMFAYLLVKDARLNAVRAQAAASLGLLECVPAIGDLARAISDRNRPGCAAVRSASLNSLTRLLPNVTAEHEGNMPAGTENQLVQILTEYEAKELAEAGAGQEPAREVQDARNALCIAALRALMHIGGAGSIHITEKLQAPHFPEAIRSTAAEVAPLVKQRAERAKEVSRLLRPASAPGAPEELLLRPVEAPPTGDVGMLVRPVEDKGQE